MHVSNRMDGGGSWVIYEQNNPTASYIHRWINPIAGSSRIHSSKAGCCVGVPHSHPSSFYAYIKLIRSFLWGAEAWGARLEESGRGRERG